jgi:hypothetical protein
VRDSYILPETVEENGLAEKTIEHHGIMNYETIFKGFRSLFEEAKKWRK